jgi:hypothetical protein
MVSSAVNIGSTQEAEATIYVDPPVAFAPKGENFTVDIKIADVVDLYAWQVNMSFDPNVIEFINVTEGEFLKGQPEGTLTVPPKVEEGWVLFGWTTKGKYAGVSGSGRLAIVELRVLAEGECVLNITHFNTYLLHYVPWGGGYKQEEIPSNKENGYFTNLLRPPHAEFTYTPKKPDVNETITFDATASYASLPYEIVRYEWDFGDGATKVYVGANLTATTTHTYTEPGEYKVTLTVIDNATMPRIWYDLYSTYEEEIRFRHDHDIAVTFVEPAKGEVAVGGQVFIAVRVVNEGRFPENFSVVAYYDSGVIGTLNVTNLAPGDSKDLLFSWDTTGVELGIYTISAEAINVTGEGFPDDNWLSDGTVRVVEASAPLLSLPTIGAVVAVVVVVGVAVFLYVRRKAA